MLTPTIKPAWQCIILKGENLARETDFLDLYKILGLNPGCGLAEFKQAYRRRVAVLHPDRRSADQVSVIAAERLQQLTALYGSAMAFERRYGRLPGAHPVRSPPPEGSPPPPAHVAIAVPPRRPRVRWWLIVPTALACVVWMLWDFGWFSENTDSDASTTTSQPTSANSILADHRTVTQPSSLALGMDTDSARAIQGDPILVGRIVGNTGHPGSASSTAS